MDGMLEPDDKGPGIDNTATVTSTEAGPETAMASAPIDRNLCLLRTPSAAENLGKQPQRPCRQ